MTTFILTWNGSDSAFDPGLYAEAVQATANNKLYASDWSVGGRRSGMAAGDSVYLLRQGTERGIVGHGRLSTGEIREDAHWEDPTRRAFSVDVQWDVILPVGQRLPIDRLLDEVPGHHWNHIMASGQTLPPPLDARVDALWTDWIARTQRNNGTADQVPVGEATAAEGSADAVSTEAAKAGLYTRSATAGGTSTRTETALVERFIQWRCTNGGTFVRYRIVPREESVPLYTDPYDVAQKTLYEAKGDATRESIRMALAQLLDYSRYVNPRRQAVLVPVRPRPDLLALLQDHGIGCAYEDGRTFVWAGPEPCPW